MGMPECQAGNIRANTEGRKSFPSGAPVADAVVLLLVLLLCDPKQTCIKALTCNLATRCRACYRCSTATPLLDESCPCRPGGLQGAYL